MIKQFAFSFLIMTIVISCEPRLNEAKTPVFLTDQSTLDMIDQALEVAYNQALYLYSQIDNSDCLLPRTYENGQLKTVDYSWWTSGFFPGLLWQLYDYFRDPVLEFAARKMTARVEPAKFMTNTHDLGFMLYCSYGQGLRITGDKEYFDIIKVGTKNLMTRWNDYLGVMKSWDSNARWKYPVIIDNMMNLEMLCFMSRNTGNSSYINIAKRHADTTLKNHFRVDASSYHVVSYDPETGKPHAKSTAQGYSDESSWARGQAWGLYGYVMMYRETRDQRYLEFAQSIARFLIFHPCLPKDKVPFWDFDAPGIPDEPRDVSSAAIMASALLELSTLDISENSSLWFCFAVEQLQSLCTDQYFAEVGTNGGFLLKHSVGDLPGGSEIDVPLPYADYYFIEALLRLNSIINYHIRS